MFENVDRRLRVVEICGAHLHRRGAREEIFDGVGARPNPSERNHRNGQSLRYLKHHAKRDWFDRGSRKSPGDCVDSGFERFHIDGHTEVRVRHRQRVRAAFDGSFREFDNVRHVL